MQIDPHAIQDLKDYIIVEIQRIQQNMLQKIMDSVRQRVEIGLESSAAHPSEVVFKK